MRYSFPKSRRVVQSQTFTLILRKGVCVADGTLVLFAVNQNRSIPSRIGITIPKKTGNAVIRNRWKRLIRESFRTQSESIPEGIEMIVRPKKGAKSSWKSIEKSVPYLAQKAAKRLQSTES
ncbi:Ribonuclease P protein component [Planctomycetes bacterium CA13]|uniref:Ribonuclease P protein component n=1 Tax=Novipirellula herctigrandis TaxID=2527986 RepID=A0A5C5Z9Y2_9BACT|nr:Ribonuclease P protein component [Planctomycetes bacterium CA13]